MYKIQLLTFLLLASFVFLTGQNNDKPLEIGFETSLFSKTLEEERPILIHLPQNYEESDQSYPVLYLLDGRGHFHHTTGSADFLARTGRIPDVIVVGIPNTKDRTHDLTPTETAKTKRFPTSGGADDLVKFIHKELMPFIDQKYRTTDYQVLIGHSFGGLFAIHSLINHPEVFDAYLAISPSLWFDDQHLVKQADNFFEEHADHKGKLYMTMGNEGGNMLGGAWKFSALLEEKAPRSFHWEFHLMEKEDHGSVPHRSTYNGLETLFDDWRIEDVYELYEMGGLEAIQNHFDKIREVYGAGLMKAPEQMINSLGYQLLGNDRIDDAILVFIKNAEDNPNSFNTYDSLGEAYKTKGDTVNAVRYYKKSLALNPGNTNGIKMLKELGVDYKSAEVKLSKSILKRYIGKYAIEPGLILSVTLEDGYLYGEPTGQEKKKLIPMAEDKFYLEELDIQVTFLIDKYNKSSGVAIKTGGNEMKGKRIE